MGDPARLAQQGGVGGDVDDAPSAQSQHVPGDRLAAIHDAINVERNLPARRLVEVGEAR
jgi:hypothetical protein